MLPIVVTGVPVARISRLWADFQHVDQVDASRFFLSCSFLRAALAPVKGGVSSGYHPNLCWLVFGQVHETH